MFLLGLLIGAAGAGWFILDDNGERLIAGRSHSRRRSRLSGVARSLAAGTVAR